MNGLATRLMPGLAALRGYRRTNLRADLVAGVSVAAVALPVSVAYPVFNR
jgi:MFS superfamily sulfate permease-like transporter